MAFHSRSTVSAILASVSALALSTGVAQSVAQLRQSAQAATPAGCYVADGVSGYITDDHGAPVEGAPVLLVAHHDPARAKPGQRIMSRRLAFTKSDAAGCYRIRLRATKALISAADSRGVLDMMMTIQAGDTISTVDVSRVLVGSHGRLRLHEPGTPTSARFAASTVEGTVARGSLVVGAVHQSFGPQADAARASAARTVAAPPPMRVAGMIGTLDDDAGAVPLTMKAPAGMTVSADDNEPETLVKIFRKHPVLVGQWWSQMKGVSENWRYSQGSTSSLESAVSATGGPGTYSKSQTYEMTTNATVGWPTVYGKNGTFYLTFFRYAQYAVSYCDGMTGCMVWEDRIRPYSWERGAIMRRHIPYPKVKRANCSFYGRGTDDETAGSTAVTWTNGVGIEGDLLGALGGGFSMSAQTGFTRQAENVVHFRRAGYLCGTMGPVSTPGALLARRF